MPVPFTDVGDIGSLNESVSVPASRSNSTNDCNVGRRSSPIYVVTLNALAGRIASPLLSK